MGNGTCCRKIENRVETLNLEEENLDRAVHIESGSEGSEDFEIQRNKHSLLKFSDQKKSSQLSTTQQLNSAKSIKSEQQFSNFVTFQAMPSVQTLPQDAFSRLQQNFHQEMSDLAAFQNTRNNTKSMKKVQFAI